MLGCASSPREDQDLTSEATAESTLTAEATLEPTTAPNADPDGGAWLVFLAAPDVEAYDTLWRVDASGANLTALVADEPVRTLEVRPGSSTEHAEIAYVSQSDENLVHRLKIISLPDGETREIAVLTPDPTISDARVYGAVGHPSSLAWSPDGSLLAYIGAPEGISSDVYTYDADTGEITLRARIDDPLLEAYGLEWSPDGQWLVYAEGDFQGEGAPYGRSWWAVNLADGRTTHLDQPVRHMWDEFLGWVDGTHIAVTGVDVDQEPVARMIDIETGSAETVFDQYFNQAVYVPERNLWVFSQGNTPEGEDSIVTLISEGRALEIATDAGLIWWEPQHAMLFGASYDGGIYQISAEGEVQPLVPDPPRVTDHWPLIPSVSPDGSYWIWSLLDPYVSDIEPLFVGEPFQSPRQIPGEYRAHVVEIAPDGRGIVFLGDGLYAASAPEFIPEKIASFRSQPPWAYRSWDAEWIP